MRAHRIKTGFHRIGVVLGGICVLIAVENAQRGWTASAGYSIRDAYPALFCGAVLYILANALGWIVAGFAGDRDRENSN